MWGSSIWVVGDTSLRQEEENGERGGEKASRGEQRGEQRGPRACLAKQQKRARREQHRAHLKASQSVMAWRSYVTPSAAMTYRQGTWGGWKHGR